MIVIIDGYNLLRQVFYKIKGKLDLQRKHFIKQLGHYKSKKADEIKDIIIVFDGGHARHATREVHNGIVVIFSGYKNSADEWIADYVQNHKEKEFLLVSKDKELISNCKKYGADAIGGEDFYNIVQNSILEDLQENVKFGADGSITKYEDIDDIYDLPKTNSKMLDLLMEQTAIEINKKEEDEEEKKHKKSKSKKISKKEKQVLRKIKKL